MVSSDPILRPLAALCAAIAAAAVGLAQTPVTGRPVVLRPLTPTAGTAATPARLVTTAQPGQPQDPQQVPQDPAKPADPAAAAKAAEQAAAQQRLQKWLQLQFDRRPSTVLKAWAAPELEPYDPVKEAAKEKAEREKNGGADAPAAPTAAAPEAVVVAEPEGDLPPEIRRALAERGLLPPDGAAAAGGAPAPGGQPAGPAGAAATNEQQIAEKKLQREMEMLQRDVTLGRWAKVGEFFATLGEKERKQAYERFLQILPTPPQRPEDQRIPPNLQEKNAFLFQDMLAIAGLAPGGLDKKQVPMLAGVTRLALDSGAVLEELVRLLTVEVGKPATEQRLDHRKAALLLSAIGQETEMGPFLPKLEEAEKDNDREGMNLLARFALAQFAKEQKNSLLQDAWRATQAALAKGEIGDEEKAEALRRAVELSPKVREDLGPNWLAASFTERPERGMEIVATIGTQVARGFAERAQDAEYRSQGLQLQKAAVDALLDKAPQLAEQWRPTLGVLAAGWLNEAAYSYANSQSDSMGPVLQRDEYGNFFYGNMRRGGGGQVVAVEPADLVKAQPGPKWVAMLDEAIRPHLATTAAQLHLKVNEPEKAFPFIEQLAAVNPRKAKDLAEEFVRVWTRNHNPNQSRYTNSYMFMYGFESRANGIPLTRSKQDRNLQELGSWVERLRQLPFGGVDVKLLTDAFVQCHSSSEVYRLDTIERVFGSVDQLDPRLLGELLGKMRANLATVWRKPSVQEENKTKRSQREMLEEVMKGYGTALTVAQQALTRRGAHWALLSVVASIPHDQNNFAKELQRDSNFAETRKKAFELFQAAADHYASVVATMRLDEETIAAYDTWFYAALGASDLGAIDEETIVAKSQLPLIKAALAKLPGEVRERHETMFANALFTRMSAVKPQIKFRYLESGFAIVGDHPQAAEARKVWDYYQDLIRELHLEAVVEGSTEVGTEPFGVRVDICHSPEIERESGGFLKYAQNQNNMSYAYNYGRPLENYRDRFSEAVTAALQENFEVLSVTFNGEQMQSKATEQAAWRRTPYAWLLLKARGPQIDRIPVIQIDFDFLDTSGYTVLPVGSLPVAIDASQKAESRPCKDLKVTQLLDERRAAEGKVTLEVKASAQGLVPSLDQVLQIATPGLVVQKTDDQGNAVVKFAEDQDTVETERVWTLTLVPESEGAHPNSFVFGKPRAEGTSVVYQRYNDADLETVPAEIALSGGRGGKSPLWLWFLIGGAFVGYGVWFFVAQNRRAVAAPPPLLRLPQRVTPFTVLDLLNKVRSRKQLDPQTEAQLGAAIERVQAAYFGKATDPTLDLKAIAEEWVQRVG